MGLEDEVVVVEGTVMACDIAVVADTVMPL